MEPNPKSIKLDEIYTCDVSLKELRSRISIIPQEPFCFKGTIRFNLDPFGQYDEELLWSALDAVEMKTTIQEKKGKLDTVVLENGSNFSFGQKQLLCLARAILKSSKLLVLDEARHLAQ